MATPALGAVWRIPTAQPPSAPSPSVPSISAAIGAPASGTVSVNAEPRKATRLRGGPRAPVTSATVAQNATPPPATGAATPDAPPPRPARRSRARSPAPVRTQPTAPRAPLPRRSDGRRPARPVRRRQRWRRRRRRRRGRRGWGAGPGRWVADSTGIWDHRLNRARLDTAGAVELRRRRCTIGWVAVALDVAFGIVIEAGRGDAVGGDADTRGRLLLCGSRGAEVRERTRFQAAIRERSWSDAALAPPCGNTAQNDETDRRPVGPPRSAPRDHCRPRLPSLKSSAGAARRSRSAVCDGTIAVRGEGTGVHGAGRGDRRQAFAVGDRDPAGDARPVGRSRGRVPPSRRRRRIAAAPGGHGDALARTSAMYPGDRARARSISAVERRASSAAASEALHSSTAASAIPSSRARRS